MRTWQARIHEEVSIDAQDNITIVVRVVIIVIIRHLELQILDTTRLGVMMMIVVKNIFFVAAAQFTTIRPRADFFVVILFCGW